VSRNLCKKECDFCYLDEVVITGPIFNFEERYDCYLHEYTGMKVADAECAYCGAKYLAWVEEAPGKRRTCWGYDEYTSEERRFYDLSYRSTFNDEPGKEDLPEKRPLSPVELMRWYKTFKQTEWKTIDSAPMDGTNVLLYIKSLYGTSWQAVGKWGDITPEKSGIYFSWVSPLGDGRQRVDSCTSHPTHWMPLPPPPKEES